MPTIFNLLNPVLGVLSGLCLQRHDIGGEEQLEDPRPRLLAVWVVLYLLNAGQGEATTYLHLGEDGSGMDEKPSIKLFSQRGRFATPLYLCPAAENNLLAIYITSW